jgi:NhaP-type Na+/H+ or K+/H+ antiporter
VTGGDLATVAAVVFAYAAVSGRLQGTVITPAMVFVVVGLAVGGDGFGWIDPAASVETVKILTSATLTVVLFTDAMRIDVPTLRREAALPERLLGIGLPLTIAAGTAAALALFPELGLWPAAVLATVLAPTDAALGQAVVTDPSLPSRVRQGLNVESGLNDGLCVPLLAIFLTLAEAEEDLTKGDALRVILEEIGGGVAGGLLAGVLGALLLSVCLRRRWVEPAWHQIALLMVPVAAYGAAVALHGSGFIAAFVAGLVFGRLAGRTGAPTYLADQVGELLAALTFLIFGAVALGPVLGDLTWAIVAYAVLSLTLVRMVPVAVALVGSRPRPVTVGFVGWFGPRGLASIVFALDLVGESGLEEAPLIVRVVGLTVALSVLLHGLSAAPAARRYGEWYSHHEQREDLAESGPAIEVRPRGARLFGGRPKPL